MALIKLREMFDDLQDEIYFLDMHQDDKEILFGKISNIKGEIDEINNKYTKRKETK